MHALRGRPEASCPGRNVLDWMSKRLEWDLPRSPRKEPQTLALSMMGTVAVEKMLGRLNLHKDVMKEQWDSFSRYCICQERITQTC